jgi:hypothetical protein
MTLPRPNLFKHRQLASTLIEAVFATSILVMVVMALMSAHLIGLREDQLVESKSGASDTSRRLLNQLPVDIRSAKMWFLGTVSGNTFAINTNASSGTAIELCETTNGSTAIVYYFDLSNASNSDAHLLRTVSTNWNPVIVASNLVNWLGNGFGFYLEDYNGNPTTNDMNSTSYKRIIHLNLQFCQFQYPLTPVGTNGLYNYYKMEFRVTPHLPE